MVDKGWRDGLADKVLARQASGPEFRSPDPMKIGCDGMYNPGTLIARWKMEMGIHGSS